MLSVARVQIPPSPPNHCDKIDVQAFCPVKSRVNGLFGISSEKPVCRRCPNSKPQQNPSKRGFHLKIQAGGPAFLRFAAFFPVVGSAEVSGSFIDRLTNPPKRANFKPSRYKGVVRPFLEPPRQAAGEVFRSDSSLSPSPTPSPPKLLTWLGKNRIPSSKLTQNQ